MVWVNWFVKQHTKQSSAPQLSYTADEIASSENLLIYKLKQGRFSVEYNFLLHSNSGRKWVKGNNLDTNNFNCLLNCTFDIFVLLWNTSRDCKLAVS